MDASTRHETVSELAYRESDGIEVTLFWHRLDDRLSVSVFDAKAGDGFDVDAPRDKALDVFYHPYSYVSRETALPIGAPLTVRGE